MRLCPQLLTRERVAHVMANLSADDRAELVAAGAHDWPTIFADAADAAEIGGAVDLDGRPVCIWGVTRGKDGAGVPWMVATDDIRAHQREFLTLSVAVVAQMRARFAVLLNLVHVEHTRAIRWLGWLGFTIHREATGPGGRFYKFTMETASNV